VVNSVADTANPTDPYLTLREAIAIANSPTLPSGLSDQILGQISGDLHQDGADTIAFDPAGVTGPIALTGSQLELSLPAGTAAVTIDAGDAGVTVDGNNASRVLQVDAGVQATLDHVTVANGRTTGSGDVGSGAGVFNRGTLAVNSCTLRSGFASLYGGGIDNQGTLTVSNSVLSGNLCFYFGGGIYNSGSLTVIWSTLSANTATVGGGGIANTGTLTLTGSTLSANSAYGNGGGINNGGSLTVTNCTLSGNSAYSNGSGGGIYNGGSLTVTSSTLSGNSASSGGGISSSGGTLVLENTILAGNASSGDGGPDVNGRVQSSSSHNLVGIADGSLSGLTNGVGGNLLGSVASPIDPGLGPLADNGGPTLTHALLDDSPARGAGSLDYATPADQRGLPRVAGGEIDLGSFQTQDEVAGPQVVVSDPSGVIDPPVDHLRLTFNHSLDVDSLTPDQLSLTGPGGGIALTGVAAVPSTDNQQFDVSFVSQDQPGDYTLVVGTGVRDTHGITPASPSTVRFSLFDQMIGSVLTVNSTLDTASDSDPYLSLREAIALVNGRTLPADLSPQIQAQISGTLHGHGWDVIVFDPASVTGSITLRQGQLELTQSSRVARITIEGAPAGVTVDGNNASRVLQVDDGVDATLDHLTITRGMAPLSHLFEQADGGGISNAGTLVVAESTLTGNHALNSGLSSSSYGGAIYNTGVLTVAESTISGNGCSASGARKYSAGASGAGIFNSGTLTMIGSTVSNNSASASAGEPSTYAGAGGIDCGFTPFGTLYLQNTIVAGNRNSSSGSASGPDVSGTAQTGSSYNLVGIGTSLSGISDGIDHNQIGTSANPLDPGLLPLGDYGGPTWTMALEPGSPALDAGDPDLAGTLDQRGVPRTGGVNIGAFQASAAAFVVSAPATATAGVPFDVSVLVVDIFGQAAVGYTGTISFSSSDPDPNVMLPPDYTFQPSDGGVVTFSAGVTLFTPGNQTLTVTDPDSGITGSTVVTL
jgi:hypothetical protein